jgi:hypothetical protein
MSLRHEHGRSYFDRVRRTLSTNGVTPFDLRLAVARHLKAEWCSLILRVMFDRAGGPLSTNGVTPFALRLAVARHSKGNV